MFKLNHADKILSGYEINCQVSGNKFNIMISGYTEGFSEFLKFGLQKFKAIANK